MSCWMRSRSAFENAPEASSSETLLLYWFTGIGVKVIWPLARQSVGVIIWLLGIFKLLQIGLYQVALCVSFSAVSSRGRTTLMPRFSKKVIQ